MNKSIVMLALLITTAGAAGAVTPAQMPPATTTTQPSAAPKPATSPVPRARSRPLQPKPAVPAKGLPAPAPPQWLLPLLIAACALSLASAAAQPLLHKRSSAASRNALQAIEVKIDAGLRHLLEQLHKTNTDIVKTIDAAHDATMELMTALSREAAGAKEHLGRIAERWPEAAGGDAVRLEHEVLAEHWKVFRDKKDVQQAQEHPWENLLNELPALVPSELQPSLDAVLAPYREHRFLIQKLGIIPRVISGEMPLASEAAELKRARDLTQLLLTAQNDGNGRLEFSFQNWVTDTFLPFADLYLQNYQKALLEKRDGDLHKGMSHVREILRMAAVEPIDLTLGETRFDSARHIGRFTSSDPHLPDGVITGVVRNGFVESGREVIRQPEVVVNRVR